MESFKIMMKVLTFFLAWNNNISFLAWTEMSQIREKFSTTSKGKQSFVPFEGQYKIWSNQIFLLACAIKLPRITYCLKEKVEAWTQKLLLIKFCKIYMSCPKSSTRVGHVTGHTNPRIYLKDYLKTLKFHCKFKFEEHY